MLEPLEVLGGEVVFSLVILRAILDCCSIHSMSMGLFFSPSSECVCSSRKDNSVSPPPVEAATTLLIDNVSFPVSLPVPSLVRGEDPLLFSGCAVSAVWLALLPFPLCHRSWVFWGSHPDNLVGSGDYLGGGGRGPRGGVSVTPPPIALVALVVSVFSPWWRGVME